MVFLALKYLLSGAIVFLPILLWGYVFSYLDNSPLHTRRFLSGVFAGALSVVPVLYMNGLFSYLHLTDFNVFALIANFEPRILFLGAGILLLLLFIAVFVSSFSTVFFFSNLLKNARIYFRNIALMSLYTIFFLAIWAILQPLPFFHAVTKSSVALSGLVFSSFASILLYYLVIGFIEEGSKHLSMAASSESLKTVQAGVLFSVFIALGFGFIENILYLNHLTLNGSILSGEFFSTWFFRSIFSLFVHIICSALLGSYFARAWMNGEKNFSLYAKTFLSWLLWAIIVHAIFDISLTFGLTGVVFIYFVFGYLWITRIFYKEA